MSSSAEPFLTVNDLDLMPDDGNRYELIEGELYVSKTPGLGHQWTSGEILYSIRSFLNENPIGRVAATPGVVFSNVNAVIPDIVFMSFDTIDATVKADRIHGAPDLAIEVLSPGRDNARRDRVAKRYAYAKFGVREYWIVDPAARLIEVYVHDGNSLALSATLGADDWITSTVLPGYKYRVGDFFI